MGSLLNDTHPDAERVQIALLRQAGACRRLSLTFSLSQQALDLSREAVRRRFPDLTEQEQRLELLALLYGAPLAQQVRAALSAEAP